MNRFSITDMEGLTGIRAHTLRAWEQRYRIGVAKRNDGQHRVYDGDDLKALLRIAYLYHHGYRISRIAGMSLSAISEAVATTGIKEEQPEQYLIQLVEASMDLDRDRFDRILNTLVIRLGIERAIFTVFYPFLNRIGLLWMTDHVIPAQEHFSSHFIRKKIIAALDGLPSETVTDFTVLLFAPEREFHEIPLLAGNYLLKKNGIKTVYFGANTPLSALRDYCNLRPAQAVYTHFIAFPRKNGEEDFLKDLSMTMTGRPVLVSGCKRLPSPLPPGIRPLQRPDDLVPMVRTLMGLTGDQAGNT
ncbi:MAG: hypothetical protein RJA57_691 [Bacteroidota bacterium]|jgi:DNA-binding transcriptional MerR regulator